MPSGQMKREDTVLEITEIESLIDDAPDKSTGKSERLSPTSLSPNETSIAQTTERPTCPNDERIIMLTGQTKPVNAILEIVGIDDAPGKSTRSTGKSGEITPVSSPANETSIVRYTQITTNTTSPPTGRLSEALDQYFKITDRSSSITTEIRGGIVGFLTVAYIVLLNPQVMSHSGIPSQFAASATCVASCIATLICGLRGNLPVGCAPGLGLTAYFVYGMTPALENHAETAYLSGLFLVFLSGFIVFLLAVSGLATHIVGLLPDSLQVATIVGLGLFLSFIGMVEIKLVRAATGQGNAILELGDLASWHSWVLWLSLINCLLIATLNYFKLRGSLLFCVITISLLYFAISGDWPSEFMELPQFLNPTVFNFEMVSNLPLGVSVESVVSFVLVLLLEISGEAFAVASLCGLPDHLASFQKSAFIGCSIGTMIAAVLGCTPIIICIETLSAVAAGARTGLSAVVMAIGFVIAMFFGPVFGEIPSAATAPVLIFIGALMMGQVGKIQWDNMRIAIPAFFCIIMMPFTYSIANGLFFGVSSFILMWVSTGQFLNKCKVRGFETTLDEKFGYTKSTQSEA